MVSQSAEYQLALLFNFGAHIRLLFPSFFAATEGLLNVLRKITLLFNVSYILNVVDIKR